MSENSCLILIQNKYEHLTNAEKKLAHFILANAKSVPGMNVASLSEGAQVAPSAVVRFCKTLGFTGFPALKISLAMGVSSLPENMISPAVLRDDDTKTVMQKVFSSGIKALRDTAAMLDGEALQKIVDMIHSSEKTVFFGTGTSATIAMDAQFRIMQLGYNTMCETDTLAMNLTAVNLTKRDLAIGISHSGRTTVTCDALALARRAGAKTASITSFGDSKITKYSDVFINVYSDENRYPVEAVSARIAHITVLDTITVALSLKDYERSMEKIEQNKAVLSAMRGGKINA